MKTCYIFCDESRQSQHRYMVLGGIIINARRLSTFENTMDKFRHQCNMTKEFKWTKVSSAKLEEYKKFVDHFFALNDTDHAHFHCIIIDMHQMNHKKYNNGDPDLGFYKFYYQLLLHSFGIRYYNRGVGAFIVCLDERTSKHSLSEFRNILNNGIYKRYEIPTSPFKSVEARDSKMSNVMQISDIILGAIGYHKNGYHLISDSSKAKVDLANHIAQKAGLKILGEGTRYGIHRFTTWNFMPRK